MRYLLTEIIHSRLILFYICLFLIILLIKKIGRIKIAVNTIWFSADGCIPEDVIANLGNLAHKIKLSAYRKNYTVYLWTDLQKLKEVHRQFFIKNKIVLKDYRGINCKSLEATQALQWINRLLSLGNSNNPVFYTQASDILRLLLLLIEFPNHYSEKFVLYEDCNDIEINRIPNPRTFLKLKNVAFHFVEFNYAKYAIFQKLTNCPDIDQWLLTNDIIISNNSSFRSLKKEIFINYLTNLSSIAYLNNSFIELLNITSQAIKILDDDLVAIIIFTTTHIINLLHKPANYTNNLFLLKMTNANIKSVPIDVQDASDFIEFERHYDKGFTWLKRDCQEATSSLADDNANLYRSFWYELFKTRYQQFLKIVR